MSEETTGVVSNAENDTAMATAPDQTVQANGSASSEPDEMALAMQQMPPLDEIEVPGGEPEPRRSGRGSRKSDDSELRTGQVVKGTVVHIDQEGVLVDVGMKSEGLIRPNELSREPITNIEDVVKVGDQIDVLVLEPEGRDGNLLLSKKRADFERAWDRVQEALGDRRTIQGFVNDRVKGGLVVDLGIRGFVPASHVGNGKLKNLDKFVGQTVPLKVLEVDRQNRKVVLSHKLATEEEREMEKQTTINSLAEGQVRTGTVRRVTDYGAFVDLGGIDGLLHVSEMRWTRVKHPSDVVKVGDQVQVMILKLNLDQGRVSLGMRQILPDPWEEAASKFSVGDTVEGEVTRLVPFGAFVLLEGGIEGIIPNSELSYKRIAKPGDVVEQGQMVQIKVIDIRPEERRLTLSLKALQPREAGDDYRGGGRGPATPPAPGEEGQAPAGTTAPRRSKRDRGRRDGDEEGGDFRQYIGNRDAGSGFTIGDILGDMFTDRGGAAAAKGGKRTGGGRRRRNEDEDEDLDNIDFDAEVTEGDGEEPQE
ncbi:MAG: 30S ribosomal protein S1 [Capsulimonadales bacterium]|nr:30S ribosomal protein S1 [Capsulimonadales bacterium]